MRRRPVRSSLVLLALFADLTPFPDYGLHHSTTNRVRELEVAAQTGHGTARSVGSGGAGSVRVLGIQIPTLLLWLLWPVVVQFLFRRFAAPPPPPSQPRRYVGGNGV